MNRRFLLLLLLMLAVFLPGCVEGEDNPPDRILDAIVMHELPTKTIYQLDEPFDVSGGKIKIQYTDGTESIMNIAVNMIGTVDTSQAGEVTVTVTYTLGEVTRTTSFVITVEEGSGDQLFTPGHAGVVPSLRDTAVSGMFAGLYIYQIGRESTGMGSTRYLVELRFPYPSAVGAVSYTLEYYDASTESWQPYMWGDEPLTTTGDNFSFSMTGDFPITARLKTSGVESGELVSNVVIIEYVLINTKFTGWSLDESMWISGIMWPFVGRGLEFDPPTVAYYDPDYTEGTVTYQWYRVNPYTYEMIAIPDATSRTYITSVEDAGYLMMIRTTGDGVNIGGYLQVFGGEAKIANLGFISNVTTTGFTLNLAYEIDIADLMDLMIMDNETSDDLVITNITQGANAAIYHIEVNLEGVNSLWIFVESDSWLLSGGDDEFHGMMWGLVVDLIDND